MTSPTMEQHRREQSGNPQSDGAWQALSTMLPTEDWTAAARAGRRLDAAVERVDDVAGREAVVRALHRRRGGHVLVTGERGVGRRSLVRELARRVARGETSFEGDVRFLWVDCENVGPEDSRACLETLLQAASGPVPTVLVLGGFDRLLVRQHGGTNKPLLLAAAARRPSGRGGLGVRFVGILSRWAFEDHVAGDAAMLDLFTRVDVDEPTEEAALAVARHHAPMLEESYRLDLPGEVVARAVTLASNYCLGEAHPAKSLRVLERVCEDLAYDRRHLGSQRTAATTEDVVRVIAERTGIPEATIAGESGETDFDAALTEAVVGQDAAVQAISNTLRLVKAGLTEPGKPAAVLLFAGMTGVGKTELAKRIAELYSSSRRLQTYAMGNFTEPHSVSGIIGVPPGYVGHEQGGRLVNELNADPYGVFLLDEAEKAHPNVWKPFLNLFDEGWLVDQRGVKAYADRAIFVLTTNAGDNAIAQMTKQGKPEEEIVERVKQTLSKIKVERSSQPVFNPQFLSRIGRIVVFRSLDEEAMVGITRKHVARMQHLWARRRGKRIEVPENLIEAIGRFCHASNEKSGGKEGGRIVRKTIADVIESRIQTEAMRDDAAYRACETVTLSYTAADENDTAIRPEDVQVTFVAT